MRRAQRSRTSSRRTVLCGVPRWLAIAAGALSLALVVEVALGSSTSAVVSAQVVAPAKPSVTIHGTGTATVPAAMATVQIVIGQGGRQFGFSQDASGEGGFESSIVLPTDGPPEAERVPQATPETSAAGA